MDENKDKKGETEELSIEKEESLKLEYTAAQDMLKHYDALNWQIGSILIAGVTVLTGLVINKDTILLMRGNELLGFSIAGGVVFFSAVILCTWLLWFTRHRDLYNFRNEVLHRVEQRLHMYHFLNVAHIDLMQKKKSKITFKDKQNIQRLEEHIQRLEEAREAAGYGLRINDKFEPFYEHKKLTLPSGHRLAGLLVCVILIAQVLLFGLILRVPDPKSSTTNSNAVGSPPTPAPTPSATPTLPEKN